MVSEFGVPAVNLIIACDWERIGIKIHTPMKQVSAFGDLASIISSRYCIFLEMYVLSREKKTLDDFRRWKVPELKELLRNRGLKTTGTKDEITIIYYTALVFGAEQLSVPVKVTMEEKIL